MQKLPVGVVISVAFHAVAIACVLGLVSEREDEDELGTRQPVTIEMIDAVAVTEPAPAVAVVLFDDPPAVATVEPPRAPAQRMAIATPASTTTAVATVETTIPTAPIEPAQPNRYYTMRTPRRVDLSIRPGFRDDLDHAPKGATPAPAREVEETGKLQPSGGGTYRSDEGVFTAKVGKDGSVDLKDSKNLRIHVPNPVKIPKQIGKAVADWASQENKTPNDPERVAVNNNRPVDKDTRPDHGQTGVPIAGGSFDVTDALLRRKGQDPYFAKKLKYLDSTRDERVQIGTRYKAQLLKQSTQLMQKNLEVLFARAADPAARKRGLFELWDDCAETGEPAVIEAGRAARTLVVGTIRARFPPTGPDAFSSQELAALNARRHSKALFAPYE